MIREIELGSSKNAPDLKRIQATYFDLIHDKVHSDFCCFCPSCLYHLHKKTVGKYSKEIFFLDWLQFEINVSLRSQRDKLVFEGPHDRGTIRTFIEGRDFLDLVKNRGSLKVLSEYIKKNFPQVDHDYKRIKRRLWRFKKSGTYKSLEQEKTKEWIKSHPVSRRNHPLMKFKLLQQIADFIYSQPDRRVTQREICRRYFQKKSIDDLAEVWSWLKSNYGIEQTKGKRKNQIIYIGTRKNSKERFFGVGV